MAALVAWVAAPTLPAEAVSSCASSVAAADLVAASTLPDLSDDLESLAQSVEKKTLQRLDVEARRAGDQSACLAAALAAQLGGAGVKAPLLGLLTALDLQPETLAYHRPLPPDPLTASVLELYRAFGVQATPAQVLRLAEDASRLPPGVQQAGAALTFAVADAKPLLDAAYAALDGTERGELAGLWSEIEEAQARHAADPYGEAFMQEPALGRLGELGDQVDWGQLGQAALVLASAVDSVRAGASTTLSNQGQFGFLDPMGFVEIRGQGDNEYALPRMVVLDTGGTESYLGPAGAAFPMDGGFPLSLAYDHQGDDTYDHAGFAQGVGRFGVGLLYDGGGNDRYVAKEQAQGWGFMGFGYLYDAGGADAYSMSKNGQGATIEGFGLLVDDGVAADTYQAHETAQASSAADQGQRLQTAALLLDAGGDDLYVGESSMQGQAAASLSVLLDRGAGRDTYAATGASQARQCGGVAVLVDEGGADTYTSQRNSQAWSTCAGGMSGLFDLGVADETYRMLEFSGQAVIFSGGNAVLYDEGGNDRYEAGPDAQGHGVGASSGALLYDRDGDDVYVAGSRSQGFGQSFGQGVLYDRAGADSYTAPTLAQGAGDFPGGVGLLLDRGGADRYVASSLAQGAGRNGATGALVDYGNHDTYEVGERGQGWGEAVVVPGGLGLLVDGSGLDSYTAPGAADDTTWTQGQVGIGVDARVEMARVN